MLLDPTFDILPIRTLFYMLEHQCRLQPQLLWVVIKKYVEKRAKSLHSLNLVTWLKYWPSCQVHFDPTKTTPSTSWKGCWAGRKSRSGSCGGRRSLCSCQYINRFLCFRGRKLVTILASFCSTVILFCCWARVVVARLVNYYGYTLAIFYAVRGKMGGISDSHMGKSLCNTSSSAFIAQ